MFCSECGKSAHGKFCTHCGTPLAIEGPQLYVADDVVPVELVPELETEVRYEAILKFPGVREKIERHSLMAPKRLSAEQFLALADKLVPLGVSLEGLAGVIQPLYARMGVKTGKERRHQVPAPVGQVIVRALCSLARHGQKLQNVTQAADGCLLEAVLPSDLFSSEGSLLVSVHGKGSLSAVSGVTHIGGQWFDWGKSNRCLEQLFVDLACDAA